MEDGFLYQLALAVQLQCADFLRCLEIVASGGKRGPLYTIRWHHIVADRAEIDDTHRPFRGVFCSHHEKWKKQFGEIEVPCKVNPYLILFKDNVDFCKASIPKTLVPNCISYPWLVSLSIIA